MQIELQRAQQVHFKEQFLAMQAAQDRAEFERVLAAQKEIIKAEEGKQRADHVRARAGARGH